MVEQLQKNRRLLVGSISLCAIVAGLFAYGMSGGKIAVYRKPSYQVPETLDPVRSMSTAENAIGQLLYEGLFTIDRLLNIRPQLARSWQLDESGRVYTFKLKENVVFHDGTPLSAQHVIDMFRRLSASDSPVRTRYARIRQVVPFDQQTIKVVLDNPYPPFIALLAAPAAKMTISRDGIVIRSVLGLFMSLS